ncbi:MAG: 6,7-dimethyl-8-ribityllumazine synthase [SAR324 cluster bacterium]|nr:6,7-dimethyl-8-ribityllumazine synthase [SAR324 cluster bacterium]MBL7034144.1 6,7-dimethyl-8-ribityllumazine synthase [SAR324 cluster bacterium]
MVQLEGDLLAAELKIAFVVARFNEFVSERLLEGALDTFVRHGGNKDNVALLRVPGAFELPLAAKKIATSGKYDAVVCLGAVIRGETSHYDYVCANASSGIASASLETGTPVSFGLLTTDTIEQAIERSGTKAGNQGRDATDCAIEMARLLKQISEAQ